MSSKRIRREIEVQTPINIRRRRTNLNHNTDEEYIHETSTKMPKKSSKKASSKIHSINSSKILRTPKKLTLTVKSPMKSEKSRTFKNKKLRIMASPSNVNNITAGGPLKASTPKEKKHLYKMNNKHKAFNVSQSLDNTFEISNCNELDTHQETTIAVENEQDEVKEKDGTYELIEPKTPNLRERFQNRRSVEETNLNEKMAKKSFKVRFTSPSSDTDCIYNLRSQNKHTENSNNITIREKSKKNAARTPINVFRRRSHSLSNSIISVTKDLTPSSQLRHKSKSIANVNTVSTSSFNLPVKIPDPKYSATKKVPNFAEIHKRMFTKSESIVDAKKRVERRHATLTAQKIKDSTRIKINSKERKLLQNEPCSSPYNRFGFNIRKADAMNSIMKQRNSQLIRNKQQQQNRAVLKGVRTNRRFELQMKSRNINF